MDGARKDQMVASYVDGKEMESGVDGDVLYSLVGLNRGRVGDDLQEREERAGSRGPGSLQTGE